MNHSFLYPQPCVISSRVGLRSAQWWTLANRRTGTFCFCVFLNPEPSCKISNYPAGERSHMEEVDVSGMYKKKPACMLQPTWFGSLVIHSPCSHWDISPKTYNEEVWIWAHGRRRYVLPDMYRGSDTTEKSYGWTRLRAEGFRTTCAHHIPPVSMQSKPTQSPGQQESSFF